MTPKDIIGYPRDGLVWLLENPASPCFERVKRGPMKGSLTARAAKLEAAARAELRTREQG